MSTSSGHRHVPLVPEAQLCSHLEARRLSSSHGHKHNIISRIRHNRRPALLATFPFFAASGRCQMCPPPTPSLLLATSLVLL